MLERCEKDCLLSVADNFIYLLQKLQKHVAVAESVTAEIGDDIANSEIVKETERRHQFFPSWSRNNS